MHIGQFNANLMLSVCFTLDCVVTKYQVLSIKRSYLFGLKYPFYQVTSCYGLLSTSMISAPPVATGQRISLPYYSKCRYVAVPARSSQEVGICDINRFDKIIISKAGSVQLYKERPAFLVYHIYGTHLFDIKVLKY